MSPTETVTKRPPPSSPWAITAFGVVVGGLMVTALIYQRTRPFRASSDGDDPASPIVWATTAGAWRGRIGQTVTLRCPGGTPGTIWGTDLYTDDSSVCTAALHSGRVRADTGGVVRIILHPGLPAYEASARNGVNSRAFGRFGGSFSIAGGPAPGLITVRPEATHTVVERPSWAANATAWRGRNGEAVTVQCAANGAPASVWGTDLYTDDSSVCTAALHAGRIALERGGPVTIYIRDGQPAYQGSARNGVTSASFQAYPGSFTFDPARMGVQVLAPPGSTAIAWSANALTTRAQVGLSRRLYCPPGGAFATVWGSGPYTDDSSLCTAAVHAGLITAAAGGAFTAQNAPGQARYRGSARNGVTTVDYGVFPGSVALSR